METWKEIPGFKNFYSASNEGMIKSLDRTAFAGIARRGLRRWRGKLLKLNTDKDGYLLVVLRSPNKSGTFKVHRLVAETFIINDGNLPQINHKNGIKTDNSV